MAGTSKLLGLSVAPGRGICIVGIGGSQVQGRLMWRCCAIR